MAKQRGLVFPIVETEVVLVCHVSVGKGLDSKLDSGRLGYSEEVKPLIFPISILYY